MGRSHIDMSFMPIFMVVHEGQLTDQEFADYLAETERSLYGPESRKRVLIQDARNAGQSPPTQRKMQAEWLKKHEARLRNIALGTAFVIDSALVRGILTAILWLQPLPMPHEVCGTIEEALDWADKRLKENNIEAPPNARIAILMKYGKRKLASG